MAYWLIKSEPFKWSWRQQVENKRTHWDGVRNYQASNNLKAMKIGDKAFFYHSNDGKEIVGIVKVVKEYYPDPSDPKGRFGMVDFEAVRPFEKPVTLEQAKTDPALEDIALVRHSRLSVQPVTDEQWRHICRLGETDPS